MQIVQTPSFKKQCKKLHHNQKVCLDKAVRQILETPDIGELKKGDLSGVRVYKFKMIGQVTLLGYEVFDEQMQLVLLALGVHENFYRDLRQ